MRPRVLPHAQTGLLRRSSRESSVRLTFPSTRTRSCTPAASARSRKAARSSPSPQMTSVAGIVTRASASMMTSKPFLFFRVPTAMTIGAAIPSRAFTASRSRCGLNGLRLDALLDDPHACCRPAQCNGFSAHEATSLHTRRGRLNQNDEAPHTRRSLESAGDPTLGPPPQLGVGLHEEVELVGRQGGALFLQLAEHAQTIVLETKAEDFVGEQAGHDLLDSEARHRLHPSTGSLCCDPPPSRANTRPSTECVEVAIT